MDYTGQVKSPFINGEAKLSVGKDALTLITPLDAHAIPYVDVTAIQMEGYAVKITTETEAFAITQLGFDCERLYDEVYAAYNAEVRRALFAHGTPTVTARGEYSYTENGISVRGNALFEVYGDCVLLLPPNDKARRVPLCFVAALEQGDYRLTLRLDTGESYTFSKLGYDTEPFSDAIAKQLRTLRENAIKAARDIDDRLTSVQAAAIAKLMPEGVAVSIGELSSIAPSFVKALEEKIKESRSAESYAVLKSICDPAQICVGIKKKFAEWRPTDTADGEEQDETDAADVPATEDGSSEADQEEEVEPDEYMVWLIAPGSNGNTAAVEFAVAPNESAATFVYRFGGGFDAFARALNRAVEAIVFKREVIRLTDDELRKPEYAKYAMAIRRNGSLRLIRQGFAGRVVHSSLEKWKRDLLGYMQ